MRPICMHLTEPTGVHFHNTTEALVEECHHVVTAVTAEQFNLINTQLRLER